MDVKVIFGRDTPAYASATFSIPDGLNQAELIAALKALAPEADDLAFRPAHDWSSLRIEAAETENGVLVEDIPIEPRPYDVGLMFDHFMRGMIEVRDAVDYWFDQSGRDDGRRETRHATVRLPGGAAHSVSFESAGKMRKRALQMLALDALFRAGVTIEVESA